VFTIASCRVQSLHDIEVFLAEVPHIRTLLESVAALNIGDCWIGAGLVRNAVWDHLHGNPIELVVGTDVDVIYCDRANASPRSDMAIHRRLASDNPGIPWSVHNQARMHERNGDPPYENSEDALRYWPETATAVAARLHNSRVQVIAPLGVDDLVALIVRPGPAFARKMDVYEKRLASKEWAKRWPQLRFIE